MAGDMQDMLVQHIKLLIDPTSIPALVGDSQKAAQAAAAALATALERQGQDVVQFQRKLIQLRADFEAKAQANRATLTDAKSAGMVSRQAKAIAQEYEAQLTTLLKPMPKKFQEGFNEALKATAAELTGQRPKEVAKVLSQALENAVKATGASLGEAATGTVKSAAKAQQDEIKRSGEATRRVFTDEQKKLGAAYIAAKVQSTKGLPNEREDAKARAAAAKAELAQLIPKGVAWNVANVLQAMGLPSIAEAKAAAKEEVNAVDALRGQALADQRKLYGEQVSARLKEFRAQIQASVNQLPAGLGHDNQAEVSVKQAGSAAAYQYLEGMRGFLSKSQFEGFHLAFTQAVRTMYPEAKAAGEAIGAKLVEGETKQFSDDWRNASKKQAAQISLTTPDRLNTMQTLAKKTYVLSQDPSRYERNELIGGHLDMEKIVNQLTTDYGEQMELIQHYNKSLETLRAGGQLSAITKEAAAVTAATPLVVKAVEQSMVAKAAAVTAAAPLVTKAVEQAERRLSEQLTLFEAVVKKSTVPPNPKNYLQFANETILAGLDPKRAQALAAQFEESLNHILAVKAKVKQAIRDETAFTLNTPGAQLAKGPGLVPPAASTGEQVGKALVDGEIKGLKDSQPQLEYTFDNQQLALGRRAKKAIAAVNAVSPGPEQQALETKARDAVDRLRQILSTSLMTDRPLDDIFAMMFPQDQAIRDKATKQEKLRATAEAAAIKDNTPTVLRAFTDRQRELGGQVVSLQNKLVQSPAGQKDEVRDTLRQTISRLRDTLPNDLSTLPVTKVLAMMFPPLPAVEAAAKNIGHAAGAALAEEEEAVLLTAEQRIALELAKSTGTLAETLDTHAQEAQGRIRNIRTPDRAEREDEVQRVLAEAKAKAQHTFETSRGLGSGIRSELQAEFNQLLHVAEQEGRKQGLALIEGQIKGAEAAAPALTQAVHNALTGTFSSFAALKEAADQLGQELGNEVGKAEAQALSGKLANALQQHLNTARAQLATLPVGATGKDARDIRLNAHSLATGVVDAEEFGLSDAGKSSIMTSFMQALKAFPTVLTPAAVTAGKAVGEAVGTTAAAEAAAVLKRQLTAKLEGLAAQFSKEAELQPQHAARIAASGYVRAKQVVKSQPEQVQDELLATYRQSASAQSQFSKLYFDGLLTTMMPESAVTGKKIGSTLGKNIVLGINEEGKLSGRNFSSVLNVDTILKTIETKAQQLRGQLAERLEGLGQRYRTGTTETVFNENGDPSGLRRIQPTKQATIAAADEVVKQFMQELGEAIGKYGDVLPQAVRTQLFEKLKVDRQALATATVAGAPYGKTLVKSITDAASQEMSEAIVVLDRKRAQLFRQLRNPMQEVQTTGIMPGRGTPPSRIKLPDETMPFPGVSGMPDIRQVVAPQEIQDLLARQRNNRAVQITSGSAVQRGFGSKDFITQISSTADQISKVWQAAIKAELLVTGRTEAADAALAAGNSWWSTFTTAAIDGLKGGKAKLQSVVKEWTTVMKLPNVNEIEVPRAVQTRAYANAKGDADKYVLTLGAVKRAMQIEGAEATKLGSVLKSLGVTDIEKHSQALQTAAAQFQSFLKSAGGVAEVNKSLGQTAGPAGTAAASVNKLAESLGTGGGGSGSGGGLRGAVGGLFGPLNSLAQSFGLYLGAYQFVSFLKDSVKASNEAEVAWARLSQTVSNAGVKFSTVSPDVEKMVVAGRKLGFSEKDTVDMLTTLTTLTGSYDTALKALPATMDLVVGRHMTVDQAAKNLSRALDGNTSAFSRQGIILNKYKDVLGQVEDKVGGDAAAVMTAYGGQVKAVSAEFNGLQIAMGDAFKAGLEGGAMNAVVETLEAMVHWVKENKELFGAIVTVVAAVAESIVGLGGVIKDAFFTVPMLLITPIMAGLMGIPRVAKFMVSSVMLVIGELALGVTRIWDKVFHTDLSASVNKSIAEFRRMKTEAQKEMDQLGKRTTAVEKGYVADLMQRPRGPGENSLDEQPKKPKAQNFPLGQNRPFNVGAEAQETTKIAQLGNIMRKGDLDDAATAAKDLSTTYETILKQLADSKSATAEIAKNEGDIADDVAKQVLSPEEQRALESRKATIEGIQKAYDKRLNNDAADKRAEAALERRIVLLSKVAEKGPLEDQVTALKELDDLHGKLLAKQEALAKQPKGAFTDQYFELQKHLDDIDQVRVKIDQAKEVSLDKQISKLGRSLVAGIDIKDVTAELNSIYDDLTKKLIGIQVGSEKWLELTKHQADIEEIRRQRHTEDEQHAKNQIKALSELVQLDDTRAAAQEKLHQLQQGLTTERGTEYQALANVPADLPGTSPQLAKAREDERNAHLARLAEIQEELDMIERGLKVASDLMDKSIDRMQKELEDPATLDRAYRELLAKRAELIRSMEKEKALGRDSVDTRNEILRIDDLLKGNVIDEIKHFDDEVRTLRKLYIEPVSRTTESTSGKTVTTQRPGQTIRQRIETTTRKTTTTNGEGTETDRDKALKEVKKDAEDITAAIAAQQAVVDKTVEGTEARAKAQEKLNALLRDQVAIQDILNKLEEPSLNFGTRFMEMFQHNFPKAVEAAASQMSTTMVDFFQKQGVSIKTLRKSMESIPAGLAKSIANELKEAATMEAKHDLVWAIRETALGLGSLASLNPAAAAGHFASAAEHYAAATAWAALGGAAGAVGGGNSSSSAGAPSISGNTGSSVDDAKAPVSLFIKGGLLNTSDTEQMDQLAKAIYTVSGRDVVVRKG